MDTNPGWVFYLIAAAAGLELGGMATIFIQRWIDEQPIVKPGRSRCPSCEETLGLFDTIPVISYLMLKGRCRHCNAAIGVQYLLVELSCLAWSLAIAHHFGPSMAYGVHLVLGVMLIAGSFIDFETFLLPNRITIGGAVIALAAAFILPEPGWQNALLGSVAGGGFFWVLQQSYRIVRGEEGLGSGDVKLMFMIGAMVGLYGLPLTIGMAAVTSLVGCGLYMLRPGGKGFKTRIPFGPFLSLGCLFYVLYGEQVMYWWRFG